jgi:hypothetical protein
MIYPRMKVGRWDDVEPDWMVRRAQASSSPNTSL